jgi:hypothetical protein
LFNTTHKEVAILGELLEKYTKIRLGKGGGVGVSSSVPLSEDVKDGVQNIRHDEEKRNVITNALFNLLNPGD